LFRVRKDRAFPPVGFAALLPMGDSPDPSRFLTVDLRLREESNSDSILNGERGFG